MIFTYLSTLAINLSAWQYQLLMLSGWFAVVTNVDHIISFLRGNLKVGGSAISHIGFGLMLVGVLFSRLNQKVISRNPFLMEGLTANEEAKRNTVLLLKDSPMIMDEYEVTLTGDSIDYLTRTYYIDYKRRDETGKVVEQFQLEPNILYDKEFTKVAASNPSTKQYWNRDVFTHIAALPPEEMDITEKKAKEDSLDYKTYIMGVEEKLTFLDTVPVKDRDTFLVRSFDLEVLDIQRNAQHKDYIPETGDIAISAWIKVTSSEKDTSFIAKPVLVLRGQVLYSFPDQINPLNTRVKLNEEVFDLVYTAETELDYQEYVISQGDEVMVDDIKVKFQGFNKDVTLPSYEEQEGDIAVAAILNATTPDGKTANIEPVFLIRNSKPLNLKDEATEIGLHARFVSINPKDGKATVFMAHQAPRAPRASFSVATRSFRTDWVALQAIEFPGINYFWLGASLMMFGLTISMYHRIRTLA